MDPRIREGDKCGGGLTRTRASEAKGPFPEGKRVGSWGEKKKKCWCKSKREEGWELGKQSKCKKAKKCKCEDGLISFSRLIISGMLS